MTRHLPLFVILIGLSACGTDVPPTVSRAGDHVLSGMSYEDFRARFDARAERAGGEELAQRRMEAANGNAALHKRFMALDRNADGRLSAAEAGGP